MIKLMKNLAENVIHIYPHSGSNPAYIHSDIWRKNDCLGEKRKLGVGKVAGWFALKSATLWLNLSGQNEWAGETLNLVNNCQQILICSCNPGEKLALIWIHLTLETVIWLRLLRIRWSFSLPLKGFVDWDQIHCTYHPNVDWDELKQCTIGERDAWRLWKSQNHSGL